MKIGSGGGLSECKTKYAPFIDLDMKYIDAERLRAEIKFAKSVYDDPKRVVYGVADAYRQDGRAAMCDDILKKIDSLQQDETQVDRMLCSQVWWEEQGWIMIPPDATIEGIDSLLRQVRKKLQQEQPVLPGIEESGIPGKDYIPVDWVDACEMYGKWKIVKQERPEVDLEKEIDRFWDSCIKHKNERGGNVIWSNKLEVEVLARHFFDMGINARKL